VSNTSRGGGLYILGGDVTIRQSSINNNAAEGLGGGIYFNAGTLVLDRVTVYDNSVPSQPDPLDTRGGGLYLDGGTVSIARTTIAENSAETGGGIWNTTATVTLKNSIIAENDPPASLPPGSNLQCDGNSLSSLGYNIIGDGSCIIAEQTGDLKNTAPLLEAAEQVGIMLVAPLSAGSPAVDSGSNDADCSAPDQVGVPVLGICDRGAVELRLTSFLPIARR
jgi:hypothetical protein